MWRPYWVLAYVLPWLGLDAHCCQCKAWILTTVCLDYLFHPMFLLEAFFHLFLQGWLICQVSIVTTSKKPLLTTYMSSLSTLTTLKVCAHSLHNTFTVCKFLFDCLVCPLSPNSLPGPGNQIPCLFCLLLTTVLTWWEAWTAQSTHVCSAHVCMHGCVSSTTTHSQC